MASLGEQHFDLLHRLRIRPFADVRIADDAALIDEVPRWPRRVSVALPGREVAVDGDRIRNVVIANVALDILNVAFVRGLGRVHRDDNQPLRAVRTVPLLNVGFDVATVVTAEGPELDECDASLEIR